MEYLDSMGKPLRDGLYRDKDDRTYILYLFQQEGQWIFQIPDNSEEFDFPINFSRDLMPIDDPVKEIMSLRESKDNLAASFIEKKINEEIEDRRRLM